MSPWRRAIAPLLICALHVVSVLTLGSGSSGSLVSNALQAAASTSAALLSFGASRRSFGLARRFWSLVAIAFALWTAGQLTYIYHENWVGERVPQPSWTHFLFRLYGAPLLMALLIAHDDEEARGHDWQRVLDAAQVGILFLLFYFDLYFVPGGQWQGLTLLYLWGFFDLSDVENWSLFLAFLVRSQFSRRSDERAASSHLVPYLLAYALSSSFYNYTFQARAVRTGDWADLVFTFSLAIGALLAAWWKEQPPPQQPAERALPVVTWAPALLPLVTLALALPMARSEPMVAFTAVFGSVACFGARLLLTLYRRRRLMEALRASEFRYASLLDLAPDAIFVHSGGRILFANPATARLLGLSSAAELLGRNALEFAPPEMREQFAHLVEGKNPGMNSFVVVKSDGARLHLEAVGMNMQADPATPLARLVIARDVTDRRRAEAERESLIQALEAKNTELERFAYTASHDLRSPLVTIGSYLAHVEDAAERGDLAALREDIDRIRRATVKMDLLLQNLLELSRIGHVMASPEDLPLETLVLEAKALVHGRLAERGIVLDIEQGLPVVRGDRVRLVEVLQNLLDNAAKFMGDQKAPRIEVGARRDHDETVLFVRDNGLGIEAPYRERVFGLFDKLDPKGAGTGVGLALVRRIVELHGGRVWVESGADGKGSAFCFTLPVV
jgi:PAS domain S-box-containing protein